MNVKQGIDLEAPIIRDVYHWICSQCKRDNVRVYPEGVGSLPMFMEPCDHCGWVPGHTMSPEVEPKKAA